MARASTPTLLALDRYARILGIAPPHFNGGVGSSIFPLTRGCSDVWPQYSWQNHDQVSREDLAREIDGAEEDLANVLGYYPAPKWISQEIRQFPRFYRRELYSVGGLNVRDQRKSVQTTFGKFMAGGRRNTSPVGPVSTATKAALTLVYDLTAMTATITLPTTLTSACEIKAYFAGYSQAPEWEIRPARSVTISLGSVVMVFDAWLLLDPDLWERYPGTHATAFGTIDIDDPDNYVASVEVYREYNDTAQASAVFYWENRPRNVSVLTTCTSCGDSGCEACSYTTQDGCLNARDAEMGDVVPQPATYSASDAAWSQVAYSVCRDPDFVRLYYRAGDQDNRFLAGQTCDSLSEHWAQVIAWIATARLERPFCSCGNVQALSDKLRVDLALVGETNFNYSFEELSNPFGTHAGEVMAWRRVRRVVGEQIKGGAV